MPRLLILTLALAVGLAAVPGRASLYQPDDPMAVPVRPDGTGEPLPFDEFKRRLLNLINERNPLLKAPDGRKSERAVLIERVEALKKVRNRSPLDDAVLAGMMVRLGNSDRGFYVNEAIDLLTPRARGRAPHYFVLTTLAHARAARGDWAEALTYHQAALLDAEMPAELNRLTREQRDWQARLDRDYVLHYYRIHKQEAESRTRPTPETEDVYPLFPAPERNRPHAPVRFVNDAGQYEPGVLAAAERAKLPPDALAVVQQMLLWFPSDPRLYWLLGELYAADGKLDEAKKVMDELKSEAWVYTNRDVLNAHRAAVWAAVEERQKAEEQAQLDAFPISLRTVWIYFGAVALIAVLAAARAVARRARGGACGPVR